MKEKDFYAIIGERDRLIDQLILSSIKNAMKDVDINSYDGIKFASKSVNDPFALGYIADCRATFEENEYLQNGDYIEFQESLGKRRRELAVELMDMAKRIREQLLKDNHKYAYTYSYKFKMK